MDNHGKETVPETEGEGYEPSRGFGDKGLVRRKEKLLSRGNGIFGVNGMMFLKRLNGECVDEK